MNRFIILILVLMITSCSNQFDDHELIGNYLGAWDTSSGEVRISIESYDNKDGLFLLLNSLQDSFDLVLQSDTQFSIERFEENGTSVGLSGQLIGDTLFMENNTFLVTDPVATEQTREGKFVVQ